MTMHLNKRKNIISGIEIPRWPVVGDEEYKALCMVVDEGVWGTLGPRALAFANRFAQYTGAKYAIPVTSGTAALELILRGLGIGYGDEVIVPAYTFAATISAVAITGATPVLADIDPDTCNLSAEFVAEKLTKKTKAVIAVHIGGNPCDMDALCDFTKEKKLFLVEDCAQAHGASWRGKRVGSFGDAAAFSFQSNKNLTCGEGGLILTSDYEFFKEFWHYHTSGRAYEGSSEFGGVTLLGTNARMTEWQAAILDVQMNRLDEQNKKRSENAGYLNSLLASLSGLKLQSVDDRVTSHAYCLYHMMLLDKTIDRNRIVGGLNDKGIPGMRGYPYVDKLPFLAKYMNRFDSLNFPNTKALSESAVWLPGYVLLGERELMDHIARIIWDLVKQ